MAVSSITQTKAEVQKLIKLYNRLQTEAKTDVAEEATSKANQAEQLMQQINTLQAALKKATVKNQTANSNTEKTTKRTLSVAEKRTELENRINRIENTQEQTRIKIRQLNLAKAEISRLQMEAKKNAENMTKRINEEYIPQVQELADLKKHMHSQDTRYHQIQEELNVVREQAQKDTESLKEQRDVAVEKQKKLEKEKINRLRLSNKGFCVKGMLAGVGLGILGIVVFAIVIFKTALLDETICQLKGFSNCSAHQAPTISKKNTY